jgi:hypothetical protein
MPKLQKTQTQALVSNMSYADAVSLWDREKLFHNLVSIITSCN